MTPLEVIAGQPLPVKIWLFWMFAINISSLFFLKHHLARWVAGVMLGNMIAMNLLLCFYGPGEHIAIPHVVFWTPMLIYLFLARDKWLQMSALGIWVSLLFMTDLVSLVMDYWQVASMLSG